MSLIEDVETYEAWLRTRCTVVEDGLREKHRKMADSAFRFFRATCFRFAARFDLWLPDLIDAPRVASVGDAHIENWGTWRDGEGRMVWGVNDFDEAAILPYSHDLVRLAVSARLADGLPGSNRDRAAAILDGYRRGLTAPRPMFVDDEVPWMQVLVNRPAARPGGFRKDLAALKPATPPSQVEHLLRQQMPAGAEVTQIGAWQKGGGSLGRPRYVAVATWQQGAVVREAKTLVPSAWDWVAGRQSDNGLFSQLAMGPHRSPDPHLRVQSGHVVRRIAPDSAKIDLADADAQAYGPALLSAMGADLAAIHAAGDVAAIRADLDRRGADWLHAAAKIAADGVQEDFAKWQAWYRSSTR